MDTSRLSPGDMIAGAGGIGLFLFLFLDWFSVGSAWELFDLTDIVLAAIALVVIALVALRAMGNEVSVPGGRATVIALLGAAATAMVLTWAFEGEERKIGLWLALLAALAITFGGWQALRDRVAPTHRTTDTPPASPTTTGGPPPPAV
jgi:hypothetical protein